MLRPKPTLNTNCYIRVWPNSRIPALIQAQYTVTIFHFTKFTSPSFSKEPPKEQDTQRDTSHLMGTSTEQSRCFCVLHCVTPLQIVCGYCKRKLLHSETSDKCTKHECMRRFFSWERKLVPLHVPHFRSHSSETAWAVQLIPAIRV